MKPGDEIGIAARLNRMGEISALDTVLGYAIQHNVGDMPAQGLGNLQYDLHDRAMYREPVRGALIPVPGPDYPLGRADFSAVSAICESITGRRRRDDWSLPKWTARRLLKKMVRVSPENIQ